MNDRPRLSRRRLLELTVALGGASLLPACSGAAGDTPSRVPLPPPGPPVPTSILRARRVELDGAPLTVVAGKVPEDMLGHAFVVGGVPEGQGVPLFTGDGLALRFGFERGQPRVTSRLVRTDDFLVDEAARGDAELGFTSAGMLRMSSAFGARNFANTALTPIGDGRLLASYDAGRPWEIDPRTLAVVTPVGHLATYEPMLPAVTPALRFFPIHMTTAHPVHDPDEGAVYLVNFGPPVAGIEATPFTRVLRWSRASEPSWTRLVDDAGRPALLEQSCHQMHVTRRYVILCDGAFRTETEQMTGKDISRAQSPVTTLWVIKKADLVPGGDAVARRVEIPLESAHFLVDRDDAGDRLSILLVHQNSADPSEWVRATDVLADGSPVDPAVVGMMVAPADLTVLGRYVIDATTGAVVPGSARKLIDPRLWGTTLWTHDERAPRRGFGTAFWVSLGFLPGLLTKRIVDLYASHPHRVVPMAELPRAPLPAHLSRIDHEAMAVAETFTFPLGHLPMSPTFVPRKNGGPDEGYVVVLVLGPESDEIWIFAASDLARGPLARLRHAELDVGFSLHTAWLPDLPSVVAPTYRVARADDYRGRIDALAPRAQEVARAALSL